MNVLITGGSGFIGRHLAGALSRKHTVLAPSRGELDLLDEGSVADCLRRQHFDVVIHAAGKPGHRNTVDPNGVFYANTRMFFNLVRYREHFGRLLITGSGGSYDLRHYVPKMSEDYFGRYMPVDEHGLFRYVTGQFLATLPEVVDLRLFGVYGPYEDYAIRFISNAICKAIHGLPITLRQNRSFDYLYIRDLVPIVSHFMSRPLSYSAYNITPDRPVELLQLAKLVRDISGKDLPVLVAQEGMGIEYSGNNARLRQEMPEVRFTPIEEGVRELYAWYETNIDRIDRKLLLTDK